MKSTAPTCWHRHSAPVYSGEEHSLAYAYYAGDDEVVERGDPSDEVAYARYTEPAPYGL